MAKRQTKNQTPELKTEPEVLPEAEYSRILDLEKKITRTDFSKGWKTRTVIQVLKANRKDKVYRHELARIIGSDPKNTHIIINTLTKGTKLYPAMKIEYDKTERAYTLV